ncbi:MAG TPA: trehalose-phosphatase [Longimicrobiales bacterium]|nr:trehalose-phosphatase [Longimicrobiales bacterium]
MVAIVHAFDKMQAWRERRRLAGRMLVAVDFDGTLSPIVERPEDAAIVPAARAALSDLAARGDTVVAVVSGRSLADVRARVGLAGVFYAGNHGLEIEGPGLERVHPAAASARPHLAAAGRRLASELAAWPGVQVEDKGLTLSVHYRRADAGVGERVVAAARRVCDAASLRLTEGKKVVELRPAVDWDKGRATVFLLEVVAPGGAPVLFIGDDRTDEDAFRALGQGGAGVLVSAAPPPDTAATAFVRSPAEVAALLRELARGD